MFDPDAYAKRLVKSLNALPEDKMLIDSLRRHLHGRSPEDIVLILSSLYRMSPSMPEARRVQSVLVVPSAFVSILGVERCKEAYLAALEKNETKVGMLLTDLPPLKADPAGYETEEEARMEYIPLGVRRSLAKKGMKDTLDRLLSDPDPIVITNLLNNPRTTEKDVVKIASRRPNSAMILKLLAAHRRWCKRPHVIKAMVLNPYTPPRISIALLDFMLSQDVAMAAGDQNLHPQVRKSAKDKITSGGGRNG